MARMLNPGNVFELVDELGNIWQGEKLSEMERKKIVEKLSKLCEAEKKRQWGLEEQTDVG